MDGLSLVQILTILFNENIINSLHLPMDISSRNVTFCRTVACMKGGIVLCSGPKQLSAASVPFQRPFPRYVHHLTSDFLGRL